MVLELPKDLFHFEGGHNGFNEHRCANGPVRNANFLLRQGEDVIPQPCLEMRLHLRKVVIRAASTLEERFCIVEEQQREVENPA